MKTRMALLGSLLAALFPSLLDAHVDGMSLAVSLGTGPGQVELDWTGGQPVFQVYRGPAASGLISPTHLIGSTNVRTWVDTPGPGNVFFYMITSPCVYDPPEICDGLDNNCNGQIDEPGSEASCNDGNSCTLDTCAGGSCHMVDQRACPAAPTSGLGGVSCATNPSTPGCWGTSCGATIVPLPPGCNNPDSDGDSLGDVWEENGRIDFNCDGNNDPGDVPIPGTDKAVADIYLKASAMQNSPQETIPDIHRPTDEAIRRLKAMFGGAHLKTPPERCDASTPCAPGFACSVEDYVCLPVCQVDNDCVNSTDGGRCVGGVCRRRRLHLDLAAINPIPHVPVLFFGPVIPACLTGGDVSQGINFYDLKANPSNFDPKTSLFAHYGIFGHFQSCDSSGTCSSPLCPGSEGSAPDYTSSGLAEVEGNDWMVTTGSFTYQGITVKDNVDSGALAHELGHNLNLRHGGPGCSPGDPDCTYNPDQHKKINYLSVMNPWYQFGIPVAVVPGSTDPSPDPRLDYSHVVLSNPLNEANLDEPAGVFPGNPPPFDLYLVRYLDPLGQPRYGSTMPGMPIDWNFDGLLSPGVAVDLNQNGTFENQAGANDWDHLQYSFQCRPHYDD